jgi:hypothetical protein
MSKFAVPRALHASSMQRQRGVQKYINFSNPTNIRFLVPFL